MTEWTLFFLSHFLFVPSNWNILQKRRLNRLPSKRYSHHKFGSAGVSNKSITRVAGEQYSPAPNVPSTTINPIYEYSEEKVAIAEHDFHRRRDHLWKMCTKYDFIDRYPPNAWEFFISSGHGIAWCNVFKAASSTMMFYFNILGKPKAHIFIAILFISSECHLSFYNFRII